MGPEPRRPAPVRDSRGLPHALASLVAVLLVLSAALPGGTLAAPPKPPPSTSCALVPVLKELSIGQGLPYPVLVRGKEILGRAFLSRPQCSDSDDIIDITAANLTMTGAGATTTVGPTPSITTTFPQLAPFGAAPAQDAAGDPKFVIPAAATLAATTADRYTTTFSLRINYRSRTTSNATPVSNVVTFPLSGQPSLTATVEKRTSALRVLVQPLGDPTQAYSTWFTEADRATMQNAMTTLSRIFPVPDGTGDLTGSTGGVRYTINSSVLDIRSLLGGDGKWCGTELNWAAIKGIMAQHLLSWNTANPGATADVIVGVASGSKSNGAAGQCAEAMSIPGAAQMWVRSLPDANRAPSISGSLLVMEMAHYLGVVPETRDAFGDAFHSPYTAADGTSPNRGYNVLQRSYLADDRSVMLLTGTGWHNNTTLMERDDFAAILCRLGGAATADCGLSGTVGTTTGVGAGPRFVMSGTTNGTLAGTRVVESYFTTNVAPTQPDPASPYRLRQYLGGSLLRDDGVPVIFAESEHAHGDDMAPAAAGVFAISLPASTAANRIEFVKTGVPDPLYQRTGTVPPQIITTTRLERGEVTNYTDDPSRDDADPSLTNDGKWVAWEAPISEGLYVHVAPASDVGQAVPIGPPGEPIESEDPAWCGNGTQLAYVDGDDIYTIDVDTRGPGVDFGTPFLLYDADEIEPGGLPAGTHPTWSPDCSELAFEASNDIWKIAANGTGRTALTTDDRSHHPTWSQTSGDNRIAYQHEQFYYEIGMVDEIILADHPGTANEFTVTTAADENNAGQPCTGEAGCSLREAINAANGNVAGTKDSIHFTIGSGVQTIQPATELPAITQPLVIDGTTQPGWVDSPIVELDGSATTSADGLTLLAGDSMIRGLVINRFIGNVDGGGHAILIESNGGNTIEGNFIGTDIAGTSAAGNSWGVFVDEVPDNVIGGITADARNVISGNELDGITIHLAGGFLADTSGNLIQGNYIGTDFTGSLPVGNVGYGVVLGGANGVTVGGPGAGEGNVISANAAGIGLLDADIPGNTVQGNLIGTDRTGTFPIGNFEGIEINQSFAQVIGGTAPGAGNVVAASTGGDGIIVFLGGGNTIQGNWIGTNSGDDSLGNASTGIRVFDSSENLIGGSVAAAGNRVANSGSEGVEVMDGGGGAIRNAIRGNSIYSNGSQGIDLAPGNGQTPNDTDDGDGGANLLQNYPAISAATTDAGGTDIDGSLDSTVDTAYTIEFFVSAACDTGGFGAGFGEGQTLLGSTSVTTDGTGVATFTFNSTTTSSVGDVITATATDPDGNSSEFSECRTVTAAPAETASWVVNTTDDTVDPFGCGTFHCSLREAINRANSVVGTDTITFNITGVAPHTIAPTTTALPTITGSVVIDATTEPGWAAGTPVVELSGASAPAGADALSFSGNGNTVRGLVINDWPGDAIFFTVGGSQVVEGNFIGTTLDGSGDAGNGGIGVRIGNVAAASNSRIGGTTLAQRNVISGNGAGVIVFSANGVAVAGNYIGTNAAGTSAIPNNTGVRFANSPSGQVGGTAAGAGNVISGNAFYGVWIESAGTGAGGTRIEGNLIGTDVTGMLDVGNAIYGVHINRSGSNTVGGTAAGARNVISGNGTGITVIDDGVSGEATGNVIEGNLIGVAADGSTAVGNDTYGVAISNAPANRIGGTTSGAGNVIAGNNVGAGVRAAVRLFGGSAFDNVVFGNFIGVLADGTTARGNASHGVLVDNDAQQNDIGGTAPGQANVIAHNGGHGVQVGGIGIISGSTGNSVRGNSIHSNGSLGIELGDDGVTANDPLDNDSGSGNDLMNFPEITSATFDGTETDIVGVLDSEQAAENVAIDVYANAACNGSGNGEGQTYLGTTTIPALDGTTGHGDWSFSVAGDHSGEFVTATATDTYPNTSEFSECLVVSGAPAESLSWVVNTTDDATDAFGCGTIHCSLREAISRANTEPNGDGRDLISFDIPGTATPAAPHVIAVGSALPPISEAVVIDASTEPDFDTATDAPVVQLDGTGVSSDPTYGLVLASGASTLRALSITNFRDAGIRIESDGNALEGNYIGVEPDGVTAAPNGWGSLSGYGVLVFEAGGNAIGRADGIETPETNRNIISGNDGPGVAIFSGLTGAANNTVENNYIGTNAAGTAAVPNGVTGVVISEGEQNSIGGMNPGTGNVISGNAGDGVTIIGDSDSGGTNFVQQNRIGTNADGTAAIPNDGPLPTDGRGILIVNATENTIGGLDGVTGASLGNLISGNETDGVEIQGNLSAGNDLTANRIGTNAAGTAAIPNGGAGIEILAGAGAQIGSSLSGTGNVISGNAGDGVAVVDGLVNRIVGNAIDENGELGIDLVAIDDTGSGVTENDANDVDNGPNALLNFPVIESASFDGTTATITGFLESVPPGDYNLHFYSSAECDASDHGEGGRFLGGLPISSDADGDVPFTFTTMSASQGDEITATATDEDLNTSEFSLCATVVSEADLSLFKTDAPDPVTAGEDLIYTIDVSNSGPTDATNVVVTDVLSDDVTFNPDASSPSCTETDGTVTCTIASISPDDSEFVEIVVVPQRSGSVDNDASVISDEVDPNLENNSDSASTTVLAADWEIWALNPDDPSGSEEVLVSNGTQPSWGTDDQIAFARNGAIWLMAGDGGGAGQVADTGSSDSAPALGGRILGFQRTIPFEIEGSHEDVMLVREAEVITVTAQVAEPDNARFDIFFSCGGPFFPMAVGLPPDAVTDDGQAKLAYTFDSTLSCGSGVPKITAVVSDGVFRSNAGEAAASTTVTAAPKPPVVAIYSPIDGERLLQYDVIPAHGWGKDPEDGQLADLRLSWSLTGPGGVSRSGTGHAVDFQPPNGGWTPSAIVGGVPQEDYLLTLTGTDSAGNVRSRFNGFAILADADYDNLHVGIDRTSCSGVPNGDNNAANAFADPDSDGIPNSDDRFTDGGVCTAEQDYSALVNFDPDEFNIPSTKGQVVTISIRVPYRSMTDVNGGSVRITELGGVPVSINTIPKGWTVNAGVGIAKFDRMTLADFFVAHGMVNQRVSIVVEGASKSGVSPSWSFEGIDSTYVKIN